MIKWVIALLLSLPMFAIAQQDKLQVYLLIQTNVGVQDHKTLHVEKKRILVNARPVDSALWPKILSDISTLGKVQTTTDKNCAAGTYTLAVTRPGSLEQKEVGCLGTKRYQTLKKSFDNLEMQARLN